MNTAPKANHGKPSAHPASPPPPQPNADEITATDKIDHLKLYTQIVDRSHTEVSWVRSSYGYLAGLVAVLFSVGLIVSYKSLADYKKEVMDEGQKMQANLKDDSQVLQKRLEQDINSRYAEFERIVGERIEKEFDEKQVRILVENTAQKRIDFIADDLITKQVAVRIRPIEAEFQVALGDFQKRLARSEADLKEQIAGVETKRAQLDTAMADANKVLEVLKKQSEFQNAVTSASLDERSAYDQLNRWAAQPGYEFREQAANAVNALERDYAGFQKAYKNSSWNGGTDFAHLTVEWLMKDFRISSITIQPGSVHLIWNELKIPKSVRVGVLVGVMRESKSLQAANQAARYLASESGLTLNPPFAFDAIFSWYEQNKDKLDEKK